ncbi:MAG: zf-TFIIB domain-containing protein [Rhodanobacter sp.]
MLCPSCKDVNLSMTDRQGIEIDYCPSCRGIWLDRGELDRLIERAERTAPAPAHKSDYPPPPRGHHRDDHAHHGHRPRHRKSLLGELFDF